MNDILEIFLIRASHYEQSRESCCIPQTIAIATSWVFHMVACSSLMYICNVCMMSMCDENPLQKNIFLDLFIICAFISKLFDIWISWLIVVMRMGGILKNKKKLLGKHLKIKIVVLFSNHVHLFPVVWHILYIHIVMIYVMFLWYLAHFLVSNK